MNAKYSFRDYTGCNFVTSDAKEFNDSEIVGSCFAQQNGMKDVFPPDMKGVHFRRCNLDNCIIPAGNTLEDKGWEACLNRNHHVQNDGEDWVVDDKGTPIEPLNMKSFLMEKKSIDPKSIPADFIREEEMNKNDYEAFFVKNTKKHQWFREVPAIVSQRTELTTSQLKQANLPLATHFDTAPVIVDVKVQPTLTLNHVDTLDDGSFKPVYDLGAAEPYVTVQGNVTHYQVKGKAWLYMGQESDEAIAKEKGGK